MRFGSNRIEYRPLGVVGIISPWNYPVNLSLMPLVTALAAMLAFIPLTHSVFWGTLAYTLIGGTFGGTMLTLVFLPALYAIWFRIKPVAKGEHVAPELRTEPVAA